VPGTFKKENGYYYPLALPTLGPLELSGIAPLKLSGHFVESVGQFVEFIGSPESYTAREFPAANPPDELINLGEWPDDAMRELDR